MTELPTFGEIRSNLQFKYYGIAGSNPFLRAVYKAPGTEYEHSIIIMLSDEFSKFMDERIHESLLALQAYQMEHPDDSTAPEIIRNTPRKAPKDVEEGASTVVMPKTPRQLEKEAEDEVDKKLAEM